MTLISIYWQTAFADF